MEEITWEISDGSVPVQKPTVKTKQLPHYDAIDVTEGMPKGQKDFAVAFNLMRETLISNGLMKSK